MSSRKLRTIAEFEKTMFQIRIHGRGGQGVVSGAELLSVAAFHEGRYAQAFPSFGSERMGAPVMAFCRIDDREIRLREPVLEPDALIIQDPYMMGFAGVWYGYAAAHGVRLPKNVDTGVGTVTKATMDDPKLAGLLDVSKRQLGAFVGN